MTATTTDTSKAPETFVLNVGPQHPATHGVLRLKLTMDGEYIVALEPVMGYIHRMHEKMGENRRWPQFMPNTSRMDYLSALSYQHCFVLLVENALEIEVPERAQYIRVICDELNRVSSHLIWFGAFLLDLGGFTPLLYAFDDREQILDVLERVTGSRLTYSYYRFGGVVDDVDEEFKRGSLKIVERMRERMKLYKSLVTDNIILRKRLEGIGVIDADMCRRYGVTGNQIRAAGIAHDVRRAEPYSVYPELDFDIPTEAAGDCMARYLVRMKELLQSLRIIEQVVQKMPDGPYMTKKPPRTVKLPAGDYYQAVEAARGRFAIRAVSDGTDTPYRMKMRSPCFSNLSAYAEVCEGLMLPDALAVLGSIDVVIPDIDR